MDPACLRHNQLPHTSKLFLDFLYQYHRVERFYTVPPATGYPEERRAELVAALRQQNTNEEALTQLALPGAVAVVTGQQVGLFSGPAYTIFKAFTAAKLAREISEGGRPAVPVFWLATEDHDLAEVDHHWVFDAANNPVKLSLNQTNGDYRPVGDIAFDNWPLDELQQALSGHPFGDDVTELVRSAYQPGMTLGGAFQTLLEKILKPYGFLFVDPMHPATRKLAAPMLREAARNGPELNRLLKDRNRDLENAGYHAQVHVDDRTALFFVLQNGKRLPLRDVRTSIEDLQAHAEDLSPNALLRPVVQDYMLPTAAYIGGPAEVAYFAQSHVLYERLLGHMPRIVSRTGFTLIDPKTAKLMQRYGLQVPDFFHGIEPLKERIAAKLVPPAVAERFEKTSSSMAGLLDELQGSVTGFDPTLGASLAKSRAKILYQLEKSRAKVARETIRRDERAAAEAIYLSNAIFPNKHLQERLYGILPFLARHGFEVLDTIYDNVRLECPDHILLPI